MDPETLAGLAVQFLRIRDERGIADKSTGDYSPDDMLGALRSARALIDFARRPDLEVDAYRLFKPEDKMLLSEVAGIFEEAGWGTLTDERTVRASIDTIFSDAWSEADLAEKRERLLQSGIDSEHLIDLGIPMMQGYFRASKLDRLFGDATDAHIETLLGEINRRALLELKHQRTMPLEPRLIDGGFIRRVCTQGSYLPKDGLAGPLSQDQVRGLALAFTYGAAAEPAKLGSQLESLRSWLSSYSGVPDSLKRALDQIISEIRDNPTVQEAAQGALVSFVRSLDDVVAEMKFFEFSEHLKLENLMTLFNEIPSESHSPLEFSALAATDSADDRDEVEMERWLEQDDSRRRFPAIRGSFSSWSSGRPPSPSIFTSSSRPWLRKGKGHLASYWWLLIQCDLFLDEVVHQLRALDWSRELAELEGRIDELHDRIRSEIAGAQLQVEGDTELLRRWGESLLTKIVDPTIPLKIRPYPVFLYAAIRKIDQGRLLPKNPGFERGLIRSEPHQEGSPIPFGLADLSERAPDQV